MPTLILLAVTLLVSLFPSAYAAGKGPIALPEVIRATLNQEYAGWTLAPVNPQIEAEFKKHGGARLPSLAVGDFDQDGHLDYVVQIALTTPGQEEQIIIVFLSRGKTYEETVVESMGLDRSVYLWVTRKALAETDASAQEKLINRSVLLVLGGPLGETTYAYDNGKFSEIKLTSDPDHPDPSIPLPENIVQETP